MKKFAWFLVLPLLAAVSMSARPDCPTQTGEATIYLPNPDDCSTFYECSNGEAILQECPADLYYCSELQTCSFSWDNNCTFACTDSGGGNGGGGGNGCGRAVYEHKSPGLMGNREFKECSRGCPDDKGRDPQYVDC